MPDLPPPKLVADERETLLTLLQYHRDSIVRKVEDLDEETARRRFVPSETSLLWLLKHLVRAETLWFVHRFAGEEVGELENTVRPEDTVAGAIDAYRATWNRVDAIIADASLDDLSRITGGEDPTNLRWVLTHLLEETARHAGHADIVRELIDGQTGR